MPPRSYYTSPRTNDYRAFASAFFEQEAEAANDFIDLFDLPYIEGTSHLAAYLGISNSLLRQILHNKEYHYRTFEIPKSNGKTRVIQSPKTYLKVLQWWFCDNIFDRVEYSDCVHGFRQRRSFITNASAHLGAKHLLNVDIERFFPSVNFKMVSSAFEQMGYSAPAAKMMAEFVTLDGSLATGAPTSPAIGNLVLRALDEEVSKFADKKNLKYTRYADDLTLSSTEWIDPEILEWLESKVYEFGFNLNREKTSFMGPSDRMEITGLTINNNVLNMPRYWRNKIRGILYRIQTKDERDLNDIQFVSGVVSLLLSIDPNSRLPITQQARCLCDSIN